MLTVVARAKFNLCDHFRRRDHCASVGLRVGECVGNGKTTFGFKHDAEAYAKIKADFKKSVNEMAARLERTDPSQIVVKSLIAIYRPKPKAVRAFNSRNGYCVAVDDLTYTKHCENCGAGFETVVRDRRICDACHDEICETLGIAYCDIAQSGY